MLDPNYLDHWSAAIDGLSVEELSWEEMGSYLFILGKMHLYGLFPEGSGPRSYLLAYHFLKNAA